MNDGWHPQDIMAAVRKRGSSLQRLARENGFGRNTFNRALTERFPNAHQIIAKFIGVGRGELWPQWYRPNGAPRLRSRQDLLRSPSLERTEA